MDFVGVHMSFVNGEDGKFGVVVRIPMHLKVKKVQHKKPEGVVDPLDMLETIGIELEEKHSCS